MNEYLTKIDFHLKDVALGVRNYLGNMRVVVLIIIALLAGGFLSYKTLPQTVAPEINLSIVVVSTVLPGASSEDVEALVTIPLEDELRDVDGIDSIQSTSRSGVSSIVLTFVRGVDNDRAFNDVESAVGRISTLPENATDPRVETIDFEDQPVVRWVLTMEGDSDVSLAQHTQVLVDRLEDDPLIDRVVTSGLPEKEVQITVTPEQVTALGLDMGQLQQVIKTAVQSLPSGSVHGNTVVRSLTIDASVATIEDVRNLPIPIGAEVYTLRDLATVAERPVPGHVQSYFATADSLRPASTLAVYRTQGADIGSAAVHASDIAENFITHTDAALTLQDLENIAVDLEDQFNDLVRNLSVTIILVFITLMLFVGWRQAMIAAFSIPLTYAVALVMMRLTDVSLNFLSLFSLLLSLGLLVDVTIVVTSAMTTYMREGRFGPHKTGALVFRDFFVTLIITTMTTVWAFVPLLLAGGIIGEYIKPIPVIVSSVLLGSVFIGFFVILPLMIWLFDFSMPRRVRIALTILGTLTMTALIVTIIALPVFLALPIFLALLILATATMVLIKRYSATRKKSAATPQEESAVQHTVTHTFINLRRLEGVYRRALEYTLVHKSARRRTIAMVVLFFIFSFSLVGTGLVKNEFFPGSDAGSLYVELALPEGTKAVEAERIAQEVLPELATVEGVAGVSMQVGFSFSQESGIGSGSASTVLFTLITPLKEKGGIGSQAVIKNVRALPIINHFAEGKLSVLDVGGGPPAGADVVVTFVGDDLDVLRGLADNLSSRIAENTSIGIENASISPDTAAASVSFEPDDRLLAEMGLSRTAVASQLRLLASGIDLADNVEFDDTADKRDIVLRLSSDNPDLTTLGRIHIATPEGQVPLDALGSLRLTQNITEVVRDDFERTITFAADLREGFNLVDVNRAIADIINGNDEQEGMNLPAGYTWRSGGANEENNESVQSILQGMLLAFALIFLTLIVHLKSYRKAAIVLLTIPLAASGVFIVFGMLGIPLSFPALIGVLALFGIVVNNGIIVISQINANREVGMDYREAIVEGASSRLEPITLSSLTTIIGLTPITLSDPLWQGLGGAIIAGLLFSGTIMLFFIPTVYYIFMQDENVQKDEEKVA